MTTSAAAGTKHWRGAASGGRLVCAPYWANSSRSSTPRSGNLHSVPVLSVTQYASTFRGRVFAGFFRGLRLTKKRRFGASRVHSSCTSGFFPSAFDPGSWNRARAATSGPLGCFTTRNVFSDMAGRIVRGSTGPIHSKQVAGNPALGHVQGVKTRGCEASAWRRYEGSPSAPPSSPNHLQAHSPCFGAVASLSITAAPLYCARPNCCWDICTTRSASASTARASS